MGQDSVPRPQLPEKDSAVLVKGRSLGPALEFPNPSVWGDGESAFLAPSLLLLLLEAWGPHLNGAEDTSCQS